MSSNDWQALLDAEMHALQSFPIGARIRLRYLDKPYGRVIQQKEPLGSLSAKIRCKWDNGEESGFFPVSDVELIKET